MKYFFMALISILSSSAFADVTCQSSDGWSLQFNSGSQPVFAESYQILADGEKSDADVVLQQAYQSPRYFMATVLLDGQTVQVEAAVTKVPGKHDYSGILHKDGVSQTVNCNIN